ncbi:unnamed protein product [Periconia digitata]|uniref:Uncharacterized protein n=1 Tax=Periconia digitata TaxID=1303443 RepID=A0A9W4U565_9PLEO|nr:unnamed protein product [Periconia digitata]
MFERKPESSKAKSSGVPQPRELPSSILEYIDRIKKGTTSKRASNYRKIAEDKHYSPKNKHDASKNEHDSSEDNSDSSESQSYTPEDSLALEYEHADMSTLEYLAELRKFLMEKAIPPIDETVVASLTIAHRSSPVTYDPREKAILEKYLANRLPGYFDAIQRFWEEYGLFTHIDLKDIVFSLENSPDEYMQHFPYMLLNGWAIVLLNAKYKSRGLFTR